MIDTRFRMVFTEAEMNRLVITTDMYGSPYITVDVHGMKCGQARRFINNIINITLSGFRMVVIHGYNNGTAIKDMLATDFSNERIVSKNADSYNPGRTVLQLS